VTAATSTRETAERTARSPADAARDGSDTDAPAVLRVVPRPIEVPGVIGIEGAVAGGFDAVQAEWTPGGGDVVLTARRPFLDLTARASFDAEGTFDGRLAVTARLGVLGLGLGETSWTTTAWTPEDALIAPSVALRGADLVIDLSALPAETAITVDPSLSFSRSEGTATIGLPADAVPAGRPLSPRLVELYRGLLGVDLGALQVHTDAELADAPAAVDGADAFFAPGAYGEEAPSALALLDAVVRAFLAQRSGPVGADSGPAPPLPDSETPGSVPVASTDLVPAAVPEASGAPPVADGSATAEATAEGVAAGASEEVPSLEDVESTAAAEGEGEAAPPPVEVLMPEAPTAPGPAAAARGGAVAGGAGGAARSATTLPSAGEMTDAARGAVAEPVAETAARAREELAAELGERPAPSPEIVELCERIRTAIRENRPEDEDELLATDPTQQARDAGATVTGSVDGQVTEVGGAYDEMASPPAGTPALTPTPVTPADPSSAGMGVDAASAAPDPIPPENTSLDADVSATDQRIADSGIDTRVTREIPDGPFEDARAARGELGELAQRTPEEIHAEEQTAIDAAQADMAALQQQALAAMRTARGGAVADTGATSEAATGAEVNTREGVSQRAQGIYDAAQRQVETLLTPLSRTALSQWDAGLARLSREFHDSLNRVQRWIDERHSGVVGTIVAIGDYVAGLPGWVTDEYNRAERTFGDGVCELLLSISSDVNAVIAAAQAVIQTARDDIDGLFADMEAEFPEWAAQERAKFAGRLDALDARVTQAQTSFVNDVSSRAITAVNEAHAAVEAKRQEAGGLIGRVVAAIEEFIDDPVRAIINGLLRLVGIPPGAFWSLIAQIEQVASDIADDPETFINNLTAGVKQGFQQFFDNFGTHLISGFWNWLFSGLRTPIPMPTSYDALSLVTFALQLMGITWPNVREILVRHVGPTAVEILEGAWQILSVLIEQGPQGLVNMIKEQLAPENIVGMILDAAIEYITETLIVQVAQYIFSLLNPAGAVAQAIRLIYQVCAWIFRNAARIFAFVQAIVGGIANVMAGNIGGLAQTVERALASMLVVAIDFLAGMLGLGDLPDQVADVITRLQAYVLGIIDRVVGFIVAQARALLRRLGIGGDEEEPDDGNDDEELGTTVRFSGGGESHRLWFDVAGSDATLMVASVPEPIGNKIAQWRAKVSSGEPADDALRAEASTTLGNLETVANEASEEGDRLAALFLQASADENDENEPPSDDALENRERAIAGMLTRLFTIFEEVDPETYVADIAAALPGHTASYLDTIQGQWERAITAPKLVPDGSSAIWDMSVATRTGALAFARNDGTHRQLLPYFLVGSQNTGQQRSASTGAFRNHALETDSPEPAHRVRAGVLRAFGDDTVSAMKTMARGKISNDDNSALRDQIDGMTFSTDGGRWGTFVGIPGDSVNPLVRAAVDAEGNIVLFLRALVTNSAQITWAQLLAVWSASDATKNYLKGLFRRVEPGTHEWIPTGYIPRVIETAVAAASAGDVRNGLRWVTAQNTLRSPTPHVLFWPQVTTVPARGESGGVATTTDFSGHEGSFRSEAGTTQFAGNVPSGPFHDWLRAEFNAQNGLGAIGYLRHLQSLVPSRVWDGSTHMFPDAVLDRPIGMFYRCGDGVDRVLTVAQLALRQRLNWQRIGAAFAAAIAATEAE
jgi:hypothetical protein